MKELILGGVRSGKSRYAERLALESGQSVVYLATAKAGDEEMRLRIEAHRARRPAHWLLAEEPLALADALRAHAAAGRCVIVDCLTLWLTQLLCDEDPQRLERERNALLNVLPDLPGRIILVGNETNMGVMPLGELSRRYCDEAGALHQGVAALCDRVTMMMAGLPQPLKQAQSSPAPPPACTRKQPEPSPGLPWLHEAPAQPDAEAERLAVERQALLIKPPGALGQLENLAIKLAGLQGSPMPAIERVRIVLFAGDHGVVEEGVSAFPQSVTAAMLRCFAGGGSAVSVLARELGAELEVINLGTVEAVEAPGVRDLRIGNGTANFTRAAAMSEEQLEKALQIGRETVERALSCGMQLFIGGEMGIGNTTTATALAAALLGEAPENLVGPGAGLDSSGMQRKLGVIRQALLHHQAHLDCPWEALRRLGGFEIAALTGALIACSQLKLPVLVDGFICTAAALAAESLRQGSKDWFIYSHRSGEPGHRRLLQALEGEPLLDLGMRLGEGSGAAMAVPLLRLACSLHRNMATFAESGVAEKLA